jgi:transcriptional regulator with XRE-family HTH domain
MTEIRRAFGLAVRIFRERRGWNQAQLARASSVDRGYISRIETGSVDPGLQVQRRLAEALGVSLTELVAQAEEELERSRKRSAPSDDLDAQT